MMSSPAVIASQDHADEFVDQLMEELFGPGESGSEEQDQDEDAAGADTPPNFWLGPINTGPVSFGKPVDDPVTSGSDGIGSGPAGTVDNGPGQ
jgi:hypothetical protein